MILTAEQELVRDTARGFAQKRLRPNSAEWEAAAAFPREVLAEMGALGLLGMTVPQEWDGAGLDYLTYAIALEEIAAGDGALSTLMSGHNSVGCMPILEYGTDAQKQTYLRPLARGEMICAFCLTEPQGGSDAAAITTRAERTPEGYVLNGVKQFITSGHTADIALIFAVTDPKAGKKGISAFIAETSNPGYRVARVEKKMGQNASDTCEVVLEDLRVSADTLLGAEGEGYRIALANLEGGRIGIASQAIGMARAALELAIDYARERITFGKPIIEHQLVGARLARMATSLEAARLLVYHAAEIKSAGRPCLKEASMAKLLATETAEQVCSDAIQTLGGNGYIQGFDVERIFRAVRGSKIYEGTNDIQQLVIARALADGR